MKKYILIFSVLLGIYSHVNLLYAQCCFSYQQQVEPTTSDATFGVDLGDFDGDGDLDAVAISAYAGIDVYFNNGSGTFTLNNQYAVGSNDDFYGVHVVDFDNDGDKDIIAIPFYTSTNTTFLKNNGSGSFTVTSLSTSISTYNAAVGDIDNDGDVDVFLPNAGGGDGKVLKNNGTGVFSVFQTVTGARGHDADLADIDGDGDLDAFVVENSSYGNSIYLNNGTGTFTQSGTTFGSNGSFVRLGDLDGDGDKDAWVGKYDNISEIYTNNGSGVFTLALSLATSSWGYCKAVNFYDNDSDGDLDVFLGFYSDSPRIWRNNGGLNFSLCYQAPVGSSCHGQAIGDLNGDGRIDIYSGYFSNDNGDYVFLDNGPSPSEPTGVSASPSTVCAGSPTTLSGTVGTGGTTIYWYSGGCGTTSVGNGTSITVYPYSTTTYYARTYNSTTGCMSISCTPVTVNVNPSPTATASSNSPVCEGNSLTLTGGPSGMTTYSWSGPNGYSSSGQSPIVSNSATTAMSGTYTLIVTNANGCSNTASTYVTVNSNNTITLTSGAGSNNQTVCVNTPITNITYSTTGATGATFSGLPSGVSGNWASNVVTISGTPTASGTYNYTVTLTGGCGTVTATGTITVTPNNTITLTSATGTDNQTVCVNTPITNITYSTTGATGATFSGLPSGVSGNWASNVVTISGTPTVSGTYHYTVTLTGGCDTVTATGTITVNNCTSLTASFTVSSDTICVGDSITFTDNSSGTGITNWTWTFNGGLPHSANTQGPHTITFDTVGTYNITLQITDGVSTDDTTIAITVDNCIVPSTCCNYMLDSQQPGTLYTLDAELGDLDADGDLDVVSVSDNAQDIEVIFNTAGTYGAATLYNTPTNPENRRRAVKLSDYDEDGDLDMITAAMTSTMKCEVWNNNGTGTFTLNQNLTTSQGFEDVEIADLNGDSFDDILFVGLTNSQVWLGNGATFTQYQILSTPHVVDGDLGDVDGDGDLDVFFAVSLFNGNMVWLNNGSGQFTNTGQSLGVGYTDHCVLGDLDGDSDLDAIATNWEGSGSSTLVPHEIWLNNGSGIYTSGGIISHPGYGYDVELHDYDADGDLDVFIADGVFSVWNNDGNAHFSLCSEVGGFYSQTYSLDLGDINGDGLFDAYIGINQSNNGDRVILNYNCYILNALFTPSATNICAGESITFTDNSTGSPISWSWTFNGGTPATANTQGPHTVTFNTLGTYSITLEVNDGTTTDDTTMTIVVHSPATGTDVQTACDSLTWIDGNTYYASTNTPTYTYVGGAANGCDSIVTLHLTILNSTTSTISSTACNSYTSPSGNYTWTSSGTYMDTIPNAAGCDSVMTINLTINNSTTSTISPTACNSYTSPSGNYTWTTSGTYMDTIPNTAGCDSVITIHLTISNTVTGTDIETACDSLTWIDGNTYYASTNTPTYTYTGGSVNGCDSIVTLHLTILNSTTSTISSTACNSYTSPSGNYTWTSSGTYMDTIPNAAGCDSVMTIHLTINPSGTTTHVYHECEGFSVTVGSNTYTSTGIYTDIVGCDTIITDLTIIPAPQITLIKTDDNCGEHTGKVEAQVETTNPPVVYSWSTGSTDSIINNLPSGTYTLIVSDASGCKDTAQIFVESLAIDCKYIVYLPNAFTPNGDGNNDVLYVRGKGIATLQFVIYNRWGNKVFETSDISNGWDGTYKGKPQNTGVFVFMLEGTFDNGKTFKESGDVGLIR